MVPQIGTNIVKDMKDNVYIILYKNNVILLHNFKLQIKAGPPSNDF